MSLRHKCSRAALTFALLISASCSESAPPVTPTSSELHTTTDPSYINHAMAVKEDKGYIDGWIDGEDVQLYYTRSYFFSVRSRLRVQRRPIANSARRGRFHRDPAQSRRFMRLRLSDFARIQPQLHALRALRVSITPP